MVPSRNRLTAGQPYALLHCGQTDENLTQRFRTSTRLFLLAILPLSGDFPAAFRNDLIAQEVVAHNGNYTNTFVWGTDPTNYIHRMQDILFDKVVTNANWATDLTADATTIIAPIQDYAMNDVIYCDNEIIGISISVNNLDGTATLHLGRGLYGTTPRQHSRSETLLWLSEVAQKNYRVLDGNDVKQPCGFLQEIVDTLQHEVPGISIVPVPVLYLHMTIQGQSKFVAGSPNIVNAIVDGNTVSDFDAEFQMALANRCIDATVDTVFLPSDGKYTYLSSPIVREMAKFHTDLTEFVPKEIIADIMKKFEAGGK